MSKTVHDRPPTRRRWAAPDVGRALLVAAALSTLLVPIGTDAVALYGAHMGNPAWLPHAKLHTAMSFFAAAAMGGAALVCAVGRPVQDRFAMRLAAFLGSAFWFGLILSGLWPGTSYGFAGDPVYGDQAPIRLAGIPLYPNVGVGVLTIAAAAVGLLLTRPTTPAAPARAPATAPATTTPTTTTPATTTEGSS